jgi:hypothetical protein
VDLFGFDFAVIAGVLPCLRKPFGLEDNQEGFTRVSPAPLPWVLISGIFPNSLPGICHNLCIRFRVKYLKLRKRNENPNYYVHGCGNSRILLNQQKKHP